MLGTGISLMLEKNPNALDWLLQDEFTTAEAAPLTSPRTCEPGPGTFPTITDSNSKFSIAGGKLLVATGTAANDGIWSGLLTRAIGLSAMGLVNVSAVNGLYFGWDTNNSGGISESIRFHLTTTLQIFLGAWITVGTFAVSTDYKVMVVMQTTGSKYLIKGGAFTEWTLLWVGGIRTENMYPGMVLNATTTVCTLDYWRVAQLSAPWDTDYGIATDRLAGARSPGDTFVHEADCLIEFECTAVPSTGTILVEFRKQDTDNYWFAYITHDGDLQLYEHVGGSPTIRGNDIGVISGGERIVVVCNDEEIRGYYDGVLAWTYSSAVNFKTKTDGKLTNEGTGGSVSDIVTWPRTLSGAALAELNRYTG